MIVTVNEKQVEVGQAVTVEALLETMGYPDRGIAVALNHTVLPRSDWATPLSDGVRIDVLTAVQGG